MKPYLLIFLFAVIRISALAGGVKGVIKSQDGTPLPFASIYIKQTESGAGSDLNGRYEITLKPGRYELFYRYLGYETAERVIEVGDDYEEVNVAMKPETILLQSVTVKAGKEDPAYTVMRKAIAKAKFHTQQIESYSARVYIKGKGKLKNYPWFAKRSLEEEGITKDRLFISESVNEISYSRPNKFEEKVIAVYTQGPKQEASPNAYIFGSFYRPEVAESVSPLSPKAFSFYKFEFLGTVKDGKYDISKIKVIPRSKGDNVFEGIISIAEDWWSIHSLNLSAIKKGFRFQIKQIYNPIENKAWLPVSQQIGVNGKFLGFEAEASYHATVTNYKITLNPALPAEMHVIDEKLEKEEAQKTKSFSRKNQSLKARVESGKEITRKELKQLTKAYEKEEQKQQKDPDVISETKFKVDSLAYKKDSAFWKEIRPQPLDMEEIRGYHKTDSLSEVARKRAEGDTLRSKRKRKGFYAFDVLLGNTYALGKTSAFEVHPIGGGFNTAEGVNLVSRLSYFKRWVSDTLSEERKTRRLEISPVFRYAFARKKMVGFLKAEYKTKTDHVSLSGGRYIQQFNSAEPILPLLNTYYTLFEGYNYMKIFERDFIDLSYQKTLKSKFTFASSWSLSKRQELFNLNEYALYKKDRARLTSNAPVNAALSSTAFADHTAFTGRLGFEGRPWQKFYLHNGQKHPIENRSSPVFSLDYVKGFSGIFGSNVSYDLLEVGIRDRIRLGIRGRLDFALRAGKFLNTKSMYFMDYKHFAGNLTAFVTADPVGSFRLLDYYKYSTNDKYFSANIHYNFRKFLFTHITKFRLLGMSESLFANYLAAPYSGNFTELGYGLNDILRLFRLEFATSFQNGRYVGYGIRIGVSASLASHFSDK